MEKIVKSCLVEATTFPITAPCPKLVLECMNWYDAKYRCIGNINGEALLKIDREIVMADMGIAHKDPYEEWTIGTSYSFFLEKKSAYQNVIARN